jgi:hypothetical protein
MLCLSTLTDRAAVTVIHKTQARSSYPKPEDVWSVPFARSVERICFFSVTERSNAATEKRLKSGHAVGGVSIV